MTEEKYLFERFGTAGAALRSQPNVLGALKTYKGIIPPDKLTLAGYITDGTPVKGDRLVTLTENVIHPTTKAIVGHVNDIWLHVTSVGGYPVDGHTAVKHMGISQGTLTELDVIPDPNPDPEPQPIPEPPKLIGAIITLTYRNPDGTELVKVDRLEVVDIVPDAPAN